jgi:putative ABC transport system permease protein
MIKHQIFYALKYIFRRNSNTWINVLGLALGLSITILIWMHLLYEKSYDRFFDGYSQVYRVHNSLTMFTDEPMKFPTSMYGLADMATAQFPEVLQTTRLWPRYRNPALRVDEKIVYTSMVGSADSTFFEIFPMQFLAGNPATALNHTGTIVLTHSLASALFGDPLQAMHQTLMLNETSRLVSAVVEDLPDNSHMTFNALTPIADLAESSRMTGFPFFTYFKLDERANARAMEPKLGHLAKEVLLANPYFELKAVEIETSLVNLADIHLQSNLLWEMKSNGSQRNVRIFSALSILILFLAVINYVNLATARSSLRAREIGLRKVVGSTRGGLIGQFMTESFLLTLLALLIALLMAENFSGFFSARLGVNIQPDIIYSPTGLLLLLALLLTTSIMAGLYPAIFLSSFSPVKVLHGQITRGSKGSAFRKALVVFQFTITILLISCLLVIAMQLRHLIRQDLGFDKEHVLIARELSPPMRRAFPDIAARIGKMDGVLAVSGANFVAGETNRVEIILEQGTTPEEGTRADILTVDHNFIPMMGLRLLDGRNFHPHSELDATGAHILNKAAVKALGFETPLGKQMEISGVLGSVVGIVDDFQLKSLHHPVAPLVFRKATTHFPYLYIKLLPENLSQNP